MELSSLTAVSPIDGRYRAQVANLSSYFSEFALIRYRVKVEVEYFISLCEIPLPQLANFNKDMFSVLRCLYERFSETDALKVKEFESVTNHDVKAVEYFLRDRFDALGIGRYKEFIHFGLTSQDINNTSFPMMFKAAMTDVYMPLFEKMRGVLEHLMNEWKDIPLLAHTHGQPASPTRLGKEIAVYVNRLNQQVENLMECPMTGKFGGATGNFNAHHVAYPDVDWQRFGVEFLRDKLGIVRETVTTQISNYDPLAAIFDAIRRINTIIIDLDRDMWMYISMGYFKQKIKKGEVGSSAMPHKVNPIDFENSEGNLGVANAIFSHLAQKLPMSRLQRDLTDSTVLRNIGVPLAHTIISFNSTIKGLNKLIINRVAIDADLENNWAVVAEGIQTILRRENYPNPYDTLKQLTRTNEAITREAIHDFIDTLDVSDIIKNELKAITPSNYTGYNFD